METCQKKKLWSLLNVVFQTNRRKLRVSLRLGKTGELDDTKFCSEDCTVKLVLNN